MITPFIKAIKHLGLEPIAEEMADMLWLASYLDEPVEREVENKERPSEPGPIKPEPGPIEPIQSTGIRDDFTSIDDGLGRIHLPASESKTSQLIVRGYPFAAPTGSALPNTLAIERALRALMRRVPSRTQELLDEEATVQRIVDEHFFLPVMRPAPSRWFEVILVVDESPSMVVWQETIAELQALLERLGAFRKLETWGFTTDSETDQLRLYAGIGPLADRSRVRNARELIDPYGQRLILVVSDCISDAWDSKDLFNFLRLWGEKEPVAIIQMLPQRLWQRSGLTHTVPVYLGAQQPASPNAQLEYKPQWRWLDEEKERDTDDLPMPVVTLEARSLKPWAQFVAGGNLRIPGVLFEKTVFHKLPSRAQKTKEDSQEDSPSVRKRYQLFKATASPEARRLAAYLAAAPLTLPIMRLVQRKMVPESGTVQLAEVLFSGLLKLLTPYELSIHPHQLRYEFIEGARDLLLSTIFVSKTIDILDLVQKESSSFINQQTGKAPDFRALIAAPEAVEQLELEEGGEQFATIATYVLRRLGGNYARLAERIEKQVKPDHPLDIPVPPPSSPPPRSIPLQRPPRATHFTGREKELKQLLNALQPGKVVTLCGPGGIGKSALAAEAIWTLAPNNSPPKLFPDGIIYHDFYTHPQANFALEDIVRAFGQDVIQGPIQLAAKRVLAGRQALLVLEGAEQADDLRAILDVRDGCGVLITTRDRTQAYGKRLDISSLFIDQAISLLQAGGKEYAADEGAVREICKLVGGLPLAVRLIGNYLDSHCEYADEYLEWLKETPLEALDQGQRQVESIPIQLERSLAQVSSKARQALGVVGMLAFAPFEKNVVAAVLDIKSYQARLSLGELMNYGLLVRREKDRRYEVSHALVHTYARERLAEAIKGETEAEDRFSDYYFQLAQNATPSEQGFFPEIDQAYLHILKALEKAKERYKKEGDTARKQMIDFVEALDRYWQVHDQYELQVRWLQEAYECAEILVQPFTQASLGQRIGRAFSELGELDLAFSWMAKAEKDLKDIESGEVNSIRALIYIHRASIFYLQAKLNEAKAECIRGLSLANQHKDPAAFAQGHNLLGSIYTRSGQYEEAIELIEKSLKLWEELGNTYQAKRVQSNMGTAYLYLGQLDKARQAYQSALEYWQSFPNSSQEAIMLINLSVISYTLGQCEAMAGFCKDSITKHYQEAQNYSNQSLIISQKLNQKRLLILSLKALAWAQLWLGNLEEAEANLKECIEIQHDSEMKIYLADTYYTLAEVAVEEKTYHQAIKLANDALKEIGDQGDESEKGAANRVLGKAYRLSGELDKAETYLKTSLSQLQAINNRFETALTWRELALLYEQQGRKEEAQEAEAEVQAILVQMGIIELEESND